MGLFMRFYFAEEYQPQCNARFAYYQTQIKALLTNAEIEHIGASSIPNAISKGDLDIYIAMDQSEFNDAIQKLCYLNFQEKLATLRTDYCVCWNRSMVMMSPFNWLSKVLNLSHLFSLKINSGNRLNWYKRTMI